MGGFTGGVQLLKRPCVLTHRVTFEEFRCEFARVIGYFRSKIKIGFNGGSLTEHQNSQLHTVIELEMGRVSAGG